MVFVCTYARRKKDLKQLLINFETLLRSKGILGIIVSKKYKRLKKTGEERIFTMFDKYEIENYLTKNGFRIISSELFCLKGKKWIFMLSRKNE